MGEKVEYNKALYVNSTKIIYYYIFCGCSKVGKHLKSFKQSRNSSFHEKNLHLTFDGFCVFRIPEKLLLDGHSVEYVTI